MTRAELKRRLTPGTLLRLVARKTPKHGEQHQLCLLREVTVVQSNAFACTCFERDQTVWHEWKTGERYEATADGFIITTPAGWWIQYAWGHPEISLEDCA
jgi:hypothetical protein